MVAAEDSESSVERRGSSTLPISTKFMKWLLNIFKPKVGAKAVAKVPTMKFGVYDTNTGEFSEGHITSNGKMAFRRVGKWNNKMAP